MSAKITSESLVSSLKSVGKSVGHYKALLFFVFIATVYGFIVYRINVLSGVQPNENVVSQNQQATQPHVDQTVVKKIQDLQDNSVNVQSLFDQARQNPFQE